MPFSHKGFKPVLPLAILGLLGLLAWQLVLATPGELEIHPHFLTDRLEQPAFTGGQSADRVHSLRNAPLFIVSQDRCGLKSTSPYPLWIKTSEFSPPERDDNLRMFVLLCIYPMFSFQSGIIMNHAQFRK
jgi:hypothetical protein